MRANFYSFVAIVLAILSAPSLATETRIRVIQTTDLHGHLLPDRDYDGRENMGGLLRVATKIRELRAADPDSLLIDCGDTFQGGAESWLNHGAVMVRALNHLKFDAWILGNHEFDWALATLQKRHDDAQIPMLAANISALPGRPDPLPKLHPFIIRDVKGLRVAIVGLTTPGIPSWSLPDLLGDLVFEDSVATLERVMPLVRAEKPDIIILGAHQGLRNNGDDHANQLHAVAKQFPEIDLLLGGHTHVPIEHAEASGIPYLQAGYHGIWVGQADIMYDTVARKVTRVETRLHELGPDIADDEELTKLTETEVAAVRTYNAEVLGVLDEPLDAKADELGRSGIQQLISASIQHAVPCDAVVHGALTEETLEAGPVTMADVWRIVPYENRIGVAYLTPVELKEILRENDLRRGTGQFMGLYGMDMDTTTGTNGEPVVERLRGPDGEIVHPRKRVSVAFNSYVLASGGTRFPKLREITSQPESRLHITDVDTRSAVINYIRQHQAAPLEAVGE